MVTFIPFKAAVVSAIIGGSINFFRGGGVRHGKPDLVYRLLEDENPTLIKEFSLWFNNLLETSGYDNTFNRKVGIWTRGTYTNVANIELFALKAASYRSLFFIKMKE